MRITHMTKNSFNKQYKEPDEYYNYFKLYLNQKGERSIEKLHNTIVQIAKDGTNVPDVEQLSLISNRWKWINRAIDHDHYQQLLLQHSNAKEKLSAIDDRLEYLDEIAYNTMNNDSLSDKDALIILEKLAKSESIFTSERQKAYENIKKSSQDWENYQQHKFNFEAEKQKDLEKAITDYENGYINDMEYAIITKDYPDNVIEKVKKAHENPLKALINMGNVEKNHQNKPKYTKN